MNNKQISALTKEQIAAVKAETAAVTLHPRLLIEQRDYIKRLATNRTINPSGTISELFSRGLLLFFLAKPYEEKGWEWKSPQVTYIKVGSDDLPNPGWCAAHYIVIDVVEKNVKFSAKGIVAMVKRTDDGAFADCGVQAVLFSAIEWITTKLYPPQIYDLRHLPGRMQFGPDKLEEMAKEMSRLVLKMEKAAAA